MYICNNHTISLCHTVNPVIWIYGASLSDIQPSAYSRLFGYDQKRQTIVLRSYRAKGRCRLGCTMLLVERIAPVSRSRKTWPCSMVGTVLGKEGNWEKGERSKENSYDRLLCKTVKFKHSLNLQSYLQKLA